jgi:hypothetical protein
VKHLRTHKTTLKTSLTTGEYCLTIRTNLGPKEMKNGKKKLQLKGQYQLVILGCSSQKQLVVGIPRISSDIHFLIAPLIITKLKLHTASYVRREMRQNLTKGDEMNS